MSHETLTAVPVAPPWTERPRRFRPKLRYELIDQSGASGERRLARR
jgi:hypothetical protein